jgi:hypothetical protein
MQDVDGGPQGQDLLIRPQNVLFNNDGEGQVAGFSEKLTRHQPIINVASRQ